MKSYRLPELARKMLIYGILNNTTLQIMYNVPMNSGTFYLSTHFEKRGLLANHFSGDPRKSEAHNIRPYRKIFVFTNSSRLRNCIDAVTEIYF
eukprot:snap_masked-scaffold_89-processed-gene-0.20-mRNA-1 protein AED:1.00 eAED:1.00 QI:0/0/0/0/1/1/4/0/92